MENKAQPGTKSAAKQVMVPVEHLGKASESQSKPGTSLKNI